MENKDNIECKFCWEQIKAIAKKCKHCWEFLDSSISNNQQPTINIVNQQTMNNDNWVVEKSWIVALLLAIFFWWLWFDRFYLWHWGSGVIKFFTFWLFWIWWIIDIFLVLTKWIPWIRWK